MDWRSARTIDHRAPRADAEGMGVSAALVRELFARYARGDREAAAAVVAPNAVFSYRACGPLQGEHHGRDAIRGFWSKQEARAGGVFMPTMLDLAETDRRVVLFVQAGAGQHQWRRVVVHEIEDGLIPAAQVFEGDTRAAAEHLRQGSSKGAAQ